jgi:DNA-binding MarR family transcriptional regulator
MTRTEREADRRYVSLALTPQGEQVAGEYSATARAYLREALAELDAADLDQLTRLLTRVVDRAPRFSPLARPA